MALDRTWYNTLVDDDGSGLSGSVWDKADVDALMDAVDAEIARLDGDAASTSCILVNAAAQPWGTGVWASVPFSSETYDPANMHAPGDYYIVVPRAGLYLVQATVSWPPNATGSRGIAALVNGVWNGVIAFVKGTGGLGDTSHLSQAFYLAAGGYIALQLYQDSGVSLSIPTAYIRFEVLKL